jgi:hypothetical protein
MEKDEIWHADGILNSWNISQAHDFTMIDEMVKI